MITWWFILPNYNRFWNFWTTGCYKKSCCKTLFRLPRYIFSIFQQGFFPVMLWKTHSVHPCSRCFLTRYLKIVLADVQSMIEWSFSICRPLYSNPRFTWSVCLFKLFYCLIFLLLTLLLPLTWVNLQTHLRWHMFYTRQWEFH